MKWFLLLGHLISNGSYPVGSLSLLFFLPAIHHPVLFQAASFSIFIALVFASLFHLLDYHPYYPIFSNRIPFYNYTHRHPYFTILQTTTIRQYLFQALKLLTHSQYSIYWLDAISLKNCNNLKLS